MFMFSPRQSGSFNIGKDQFAIEPVLSSMPSGRNRRKRRDIGAGESDTIKHVVFKRNTRLLTDTYETGEIIISLELLHETIE